MKLLVCEAVLLSLLVFIGISEGRKLSCYTCNSVADDDTCLTDPAKAGASPTVDCDFGDNQCCTIQRVESLESIGTAKSFIRGCQPNCHHINKMVKTPDAYVVTYKTECNQHLCNNGPGNITFPLVRDAAALLP